MRFPFLYFLLLTIAAVAILGYMLQSRQPGPADPNNALTLYCDSSVRFPGSRLAKEYQASEGVEMLVHYAGSGELVRRIAGARTGDLFLATDLAMLEALQQVNPPLVRDVLPVATMRPVIIVREGNPRDVENLQSLLRKDVKLSVGNPFRSAIGRVLQTNLEEEFWQNLYENRLAVRNSSSEVANDIKLGVADVGIVWETTVREFRELEVIRDPQLDAIMGRVSIAVLTCSERPNKALRFAQFVTSPRGLEVFEHYDFETAVATEAP